MATRKFLPPAIVMLVPSGGTVTEELNWISLVSFKLRLCAAHCVENCFLQKPHCTCRTRYSCVRRETPSCLKVEISYEYTSASKSKGFGNKFKFNLANFWSTKNFLSTEIRKKKKRAEMSLAPPPLAAFISFKFTTNTMNGLLNGHTEHRPMGPRV